MALKSWLRAAARVVPRNGSAAVSRGDQNAQGERVVVGGLGPLAPPVSDVQVTCEIGSSCADFKRFHQISQAISPRDCVTEFLVWLLVQEPSEIPAGAWVHLRLVYSAYQECCEAENRVAVSKRVFTRELGALGVAKRVLKHEGRRVMHYRFGESHDESESKSVTAGGTSGAAIRRR
jgi:hypothetical protein